METESADAILFRQAECAACAERRAEQCATASQPLLLVASMQQHRCPDVATRRIWKADRARGTAIATAAAGDRKSGAAEAETNRHCCSDLRLLRHLTTCRHSAASTVRSRLRRHDEVAQCARRRLRPMISARSCGCASFCSCAPSPVASLPSPFSFLCASRRQAEMPRRADAALRLALRPEADCSCERIAARQKTRERVRAATSNMHSALDACGSERCDLSECIIRFG